MIHAKARKFDSQNPQEAANGYKNSDNTTFFGYEEINYILKSSLMKYLIDDNFTK